MTPDLDFEDDEECARLSELEQGTFQAERMKQRYKTASPKLVEVTFFIKKYLLNVYKVQDSSVGSDSSEQNV